MPPSVNPSEALKYDKECKKYARKGAESIPAGVWSPALAKVKEFVLKLKDILFGVGKAEVKKAAEGAAETLRNVIYQQQYKWAPLNERYLAWKIKTGRDPRIYIATKDYVQAICVVDLGKDKEGEVMFSVGLPDRIHTPSGMPLKKLAAILEFGSIKRRIPPRPLWRPTWVTVSDTTRKAVMSKLKMVAFEEAKKLARELQGLLPEVQVKFTHT